MASGSIICYQGKRGTIYRIKYRDATGRQVQETLGPEEGGWTKRKARHELRARLTEVERDGYRKPDRIGFAEFAERFLTDYLPGRNLKHSTMESYAQIVRGHLTPFFVDLPLTDIASRPELVDAYISDKTRQELSAKTISNHITTLNVLMKRAAAWKLIPQNPVSLAERPRLEQPEMRILSEADIALLRAAYLDLAKETDAEAQRWWQLAQTLTFVALGTALRRGELLALRWRDVKMLDSLLQVREAFVRGRVTTPKSRASRRTIEIGPQTRALLEEHWQRTAYRAEADFVFCHPDKGTPLDPSKLSRVYLRPALNRAGIGKSFRPFHDLRHTALTHEAAAGNPQAYIQLKAGHSQGSITERYIHAAQVLFPGAAEKAENRMFGGAGRGANGTKLVQEPDA